MINLNIREKRIVVYMAKYLEFDTMKALEGICGPI